MNKLYVLLSITFALSLGLTTHAGSIQFADRAGGGGNTEPVKPADPRTVEFIVNETNNSSLRTTLKEVLYAHQYMYLFWNPDNREPLKSGVKKLFGKNKKGQSVYQVLKTVKFYTNPNGCEFAGQIQDAAAYVDKNEICFWPTHLAKLSDENNLNRDVAALAIHELSHFMDSNEDEGKALRNHFRRMIDESLDFYPFAFNVRVLNNLRNLKDSVTSAQKTLNGSAPDTQICSELGFAASISFSNASDFSGMMNKGRSVLSAKQLVTVNSVLPSQLSILSGGFCYADNNLDRLKIQTKFDENGLGTIASTVQTNSSNMKQVLSGFRSRLLKQGDRDGLTQELNIVQDEIDKVMMSVPKK